MTIDLKALQALPPLRKTIEDFGLNAKKSLGQNFLLDLNLTSKIARQAGNLSVSTVVEVGPGPGGLTRALFLQGAEDVIVIEKDDRIIPVMEQLQTVVGDSLKILHGDALTVDYAALKKGDKPLKIIANLPYNISTVLLIHWLKQAHLFESLTLMFQKEVADRLAAECHSGDYGRLSVLTQYICTVEKCFDIPPEAFVPQPKITSTVVHLKPKSPDLLPVSITSLEKVTKAAFGQRRKMIRKTLAPVHENMEQILGQLGISPQLRAENLTVEQFVSIAQRI